ncbi:MAG TPA: hypothetical protein VNX47_05860 [Nevskia sp.]|jgi:hypothetical protein|nr:hypothetical protein [Nevskia sp.]
MKLKLTCILASALFIGAAALLGCATTTSSTTNAARETAYAAETTADLAIKSIPSLLQTKTVDAATATKMNNAALAVASAAQLVLACTSTTATTCSTADLITKLATLSSLVPATAAH